MFFPLNVVLSQVSWGKCLLLAHIPCPPQHPRQSMSFSCLSFLQRIVELLAEDSFSVLLMPFLCQASSDRILSVILSFSLRFGSGLHLCGHTHSFVRFFSFISPLLRKCGHLCPASDHPLLFVFRSFGQEGLRRARASAVFTLSTR